MPNPKQTDPYVYPNTTVLINKFDIRDQAKLDQFEILLFTAQASEELPVGNFDYAHLKAIHHHFFSDLYTWAGKERTVDIAKDGHLFAHKQYISVEMHKLFLKLKNEHYLQDLDKSEFCSRLSYYFNEINACHPFREGNGRTQRAFCDLLAEQAGYQLDWTQISTREYIQASIEGHIGNYNSMTEVLNKISLPLNNAQQQKALPLNEEILEKIKCYIAQQVKLTELVKHKMHQSAAAKEQAHILSNELRTLAQEIISDPTVKKIAEKPHPTTLHQCGGFIALQQKADTHSLGREEIVAVIKFAQSNVMSVSKTLHMQNQYKR